MTPNLYEYCERRIFEVFGDLPTSLDAARRRIERRRGRPIRILSSDPGDLRLPTGLWLSVARADLIWVDATTSATHQVVIVCHELGHMLCGHEPIPIDTSGADDATAAVVARLAGVPVTGRAGMLGRCGEPVPDASPAERQREAEAELTGRMLARTFLGGRRSNLAEIFEGR